jgi:hypothetical protein
MVPTAQAMMIAVAAKTLGGHFFAVPLSEVAEETEGEAKAPTGAGGTGGKGLEDEPAGAARKDEAKEAKDALADEAAGDEEPGRPDDYSVMPGKKVLTADHFVKKDDCFFIASGVTDGFLQGVRFLKEAKASTQTLCLHASTNSCRWVLHHHDFTNKRFRYLGKNGTINYTELFNVIEGDLAAGVEKRNVKI